MKRLYKHVHLVIDDKREYLDGSILINNNVIEDVFVQSNKSIDDVEEIDMMGKIFIPCFFDTKSKDKEQIGVLNKYICSKEILSKPCHILSDEDLVDENVFAVSRINNTNKHNRIKTLIPPNSSINKKIDGISDISKDLVIDFNKNKMINYAMLNDIYIEFGIDDKVSDEQIRFVLKNIDTNNILLISYEHDDIYKQIKRLYKFNLSLTDIVAITSINPYRFYGYNKNEGYLIKGKQANIICLNEDLDVEFVLNEGIKVC